MLTLRQNMRLQAGGVNQKYVEWLASLPYDPSLNGEISLPSYVRQITKVTNLCEQVFPSAIMRQSQIAPEFFRSRAILTPLNETAMEINADLLNLMAGEARILHSVDSTDADDEIAQGWAAESLEQLRPAGLPLSKLAIKVGAPVMLLRNLNQTDGLNNGSRMIVTKIGRYCLEGRLSGGDHDGQLRIIPRIPLSSVEGDLSFILTRRQFPVRLCFAMTVNKSQGQSLNVVGVDLRTPVFTHGQLYVALSRVTNVANLTVQLPPRGNGKTANIVYTESVGMLAKSSRAQLEDHDIMTNST